MRWDGIRGALGAFGRRLALQALVSSIVMTGIGLVSRDDFALPRAVLAEAGIGWPGAASPGDAAPGRAAAPEMVALALAPADPEPGASAAKEARLPGPRRPDAVATAEIARPMPAAERRAAKPASEPVLLFTQCQPACESRDPLILAAVLPVAPPALAAGPSLLERELPPPAELTGGVAGAEADESIVDAAAALPGRALDAAASLVGWGG